MIHLRPVLASDADALYALLAGSSVTDTLLWDGPASLEQLRSDLALREETTRLGETFNFTIIEDASRQPVGNAVIRPEAHHFRGDLGLWLGEPYQGRGYGTHAVRWLVVYAFETIGLEKLDSKVFAGNESSRRIHEKNGFQLEGRVRKAYRKRGQVVDDWLFGLTREEYRENEARLIVHLTTRQAWQAALAAREYRHPSLDSEGFIHLSRPEQVAWVANSFYRDLQNPVLLWVDPELVPAELRWEAGGDQIFPHLYGPLPIHAVLAAPSLPRSPSGEYGEVPRA